MGAEVRRRRFDVVFGAGQTVFGSIFSSAPNDPGSGSPLADFLLGYPAQLTGTQLPDWARMRDMYFGTYLPGRLENQPETDIQPGAAV